MSFALLIFLILTLLIPYLCFKFTSANQSETKAKDVMVIAHRGASGYAPENTLSSFKKAMVLGADILELDVHLTADDSVVVMHDYNVKRTTNGTGDILSMNFVDVKKLDAGSWYGAEFANEKVPTLAEVLALVNGKTKVLIELKWPSKGIYPALVEKVVQIIHEYNAESWVILQSFEIEYLEQAAKIAPHLNQQQLVFGKSGIIPFYFDRVPKFGEFSPQKESTSINMFYMYINRTFINDMHQKQKKVYAFTPNNENDMKKLINIGVDGLITNFPDIALKALNR